ncbi:MAG: DUF429 domain-containing protein [Actinomycetes bacterium]
MAIPAPLAFLGVDLAWGERNRTGVASLDDHGRLTASASLLRDDEIAAFVAAHVPSPLVAAVDAPLIVPNETGRRRCEAQVTRQFARYHAGTYPSNRGMAPFRPIPRGARLAQRFGWSMDPDATPTDGAGLCLEVYPHAAMVSLFDLPRVLPYKARHGRDLSSLKGAFQSLFENMERHLQPLELEQSDRWRELRDQVEAATRKSQLKRVEDEVDGIVCAHLAWLWVADRGSLVVHGDLANGYIVTPKPPHALTQG